MVSSVKITNDYIIKISILALFAIVAVACSKPYLSTKEGSERNDRAYELGPDGTIYDRISAHEWIVGPDKGTSFVEAKNWAENIKIDGGDWRLPTAFEIKTLYKSGVGIRNMTPHLNTSGWHVWISNSDEVYDYYFSFIAGRVIPSDRSPYIDKSNDIKRGFAVRLRLGRKYKELEHEYSKLLKNADAKELNDKGIAHSKNGDFYGGIWFYGKAIEKDPKFYHAYFNRGKSYAIQGQYEKALSDFEETIRINPLASDAHTYRGLILYELSDISEAKKSLNKAIEINPESGSLYYDRAHFFYKIGQFKKAWADVKKAQSLNYIVDPSLIRALNIQLGIDKKD